MKIMPFSQEISTLPLPPSQKKYLTEKGFHLLKDLEDLNTSIKINIDELTKIPETKTALQLYEDEKNTRGIKTFLGNFDEFFEGILRPGLITELVGLPGSGRTQLCLHLCVSAQIIHQNVFGKTVFISTNLDFSILRLKEIVKKYRGIIECFKKLSDIQILQNITFINVMSTEELSDCLKYLNECGQKEKITCVIIDSITYPFRLCESNEKTTLIHKIINKLRRISITHNFCVVLTNDMTNIVGPNGNEIVPSLKDTFYHLVNNRILLSQSNDIFEAKILKCSTEIATGCNFQFSNYFP